MEPFNENSEIFQNLLLLKLLDSIECTFIFLLKCLRQGLHCPAAVSTMERLLTKAAPRDFPRAKPEGNPEEQPWQPEENPVHPTLLLGFTFFFYKIGRFVEISDFFQI